MTPRRFDPAGSFDHGEAQRIRRRVDDTGGNVARGLRQLQEAAVTCRIAFEAGAGQKVPIH